MSEIEIEAFGGKMSESRTRCILLLMGAVAAYLRGLRIMSQSAAHAAPLLFRG
jgi:hypothetical protein